MKIHYKVKNEKDFSDLMMRLPKYFKEWTKDHIDTFLKGNLIITFHSLYGFCYNHNVSMNEKVFNCKSAFLRAIKNL